VISPGNEVGKVLREKLARRAHRIEEERVKSRPVPVVVAE
jgi:hypothetical protein